MRGRRHGRRHGRRKAINVLGLSSWGAGAAALARDGRVVAVCDGTGGLPIKPAAQCLAACEVAADNLDAVVWAEKPLMALDRLLAASLANAPGGFPRFAETARRLVPALPLATQLRLRLGFHRTLLFTESLEALAAASLLQSPFEEAAILIAGGDAEWSDCALGAARDGFVELSAQMDFPHSLSALWGAFSYYLGAAPAAIAERSLHGSPDYFGPLTELVDLKEDGSLRLDLGYFDFYFGLTPTNARFHSLFGRDPLPARAPWSSREAAIAASLQKLTEEALGRMAAEARRRSRLQALCVAGSMVDNRPAMSRLKADSPAGFFAAPAADAAQRAAGAALIGSRRTFHTPRPPSDSLGMARRLTAPCAESGPFAACANKASQLALGLIYYFGLTPYSLPLRLLGFEFLEERLGPTSYWRARPKEGEGFLAYRRRF